MRNGGEDKGMETELAHSKKRPMHTFSFYLCENTDKDIERYKS
jgi:hypothetical protein